MIDKKGKFFGIINFVDLVVVLTIVIISGFIITQLINAPETIITNETDFTIQIYGDHIADYVCDVVKIGDTVIDSEKNTPLGVITNIETSDGFLYTPDKDGVLHKATVEGYKTMLITADLKAQPYENGFIAGGNRYNIGYMFSCITGKGKIFARISSIQ